MRIFIAVLVLIFSFQSWTKAEDISDFEIEGMSIGDSLLDFFDKKHIDKKGKTLYPNKDFKAATFISNKFQTYDDVQMHYLSNDNKYIIHSISANIDYPNKISDCLKVKEEINKDIRSLFNNPKEEDWGKRVLDNVDKSLQTYAYQNVYYLKGGSIIISCRDYGQTKQSEGHVDYLAIMIDSNFFADWLNNEAFN